MKSLRDNYAAHELVPRAADARAFERVAAGFWLEATGLTGAISVQANCSRLPAVKIELTAV